MLAGRASAAAVVAAGRRPGRSVAHPQRVRDAQLSRLGRLRRCPPGAVSFYRVFLFFSILSAYMDFTGFYWVLLGFTGFYWVLPSLASFPWALLACDWVYFLSTEFLLNSLRFQWSEIGFTGFYLVLLGSNRFYCVATRYFAIEKVCRIFTRSYLVFTWFV